MSLPWISDLRAEFPLDQLSIEAEVLTKHSHDSSTHPAHLPEVVVWPLNTNDVVKVVRLADKYAVPVTPCGTRTGLEGNALPVNGGIVLDMTRMNKVVEVRAADFQVVVEPGIIGTELNKQLAVHHLMFPAFPASAHIATIGGMIANNAGGMYAVKYGVVGNWVLALESVLADGSIVHLGSHSIKSVAGYDLKNLMIGSEGTLGIITKATLKLVPLVTSKYLVAASFPDVKKALDATLAILHSQADPAAVEMLDAATIKYVNAFKHSNWEELPTILIELHGTPEDLPQRGKKIQSVCQTQGSTSVKSADTTEEIEAIWEVRTAAYPAIVAAHPDSGILPGDIGVPLSQIPAFMAYVAQIAQENQVSVPTFGHIGDGNFHFWLVYRQDNPSEVNRAKSLAAKLVAKALELGGTCTAEHGVGIGKQAYLAHEHADSLQLMKQLKQVLDPKGILNPGKIFATLDA
jgi:D-lactate dehydrogenase (cytochrome)